MNSYFLMMTITIISIIIKIIITTDPIIAPTILLNELPVDMKTIIYVCISILLLVGDDGDNVDNVGVSSV